MPSHPSHSKKNTVHPRHQADRTPLPSRPESGTLLRPLPAHGALHQSSLERDSAVPSRHGSDYGEEVPDYTQDTLNGATHILQSLGQDYAHSSPSAAEDSFQHHPEVPCGVDLEALRDSRAAIKRLVDRLARTTTDTTDPLYRSSHTLLHLLDYTIDNSAPYILPIPLPVFDRPMPFDNPDLWAADKSDTEAFADAVRLAMHTDGEALHAITMACEILHNAYLPNRMRKDVRGWLEEDGARVEEAMRDCEERTTIAERNAAVWANWIGERGQLSHSYDSDEEQGGESPAEHLEAWRAEARDEEGRKGELEAVLRSVRAASEWLVRV